MEQARIEHAPNGSLLTYITSADALVKYKVHKLVREQTTLFVNMSVKYGLFGTILKDDKQADGKSKQQL